MSETDPPDAAATQKPALLIVILDLHPLAWHLLAQPPDPAFVESANETAGPVTARATIAPLKLEEFVTVLMVFLNAHLAMKSGNRVVVFGASGRGSSVLSQGRWEGR